MYYITVCRYDDIFVSTNCDFKVRLTPSLQIKTGKVLIIISIQNSLRLVIETGGHVHIRLSLDFSGDLGHRGGLHVVRGQRVGDLLDLLRVLLQELTVAAVAIDLELILEIVVVNTGRYIICDEIPSLSGYLKGLDYILNILEFVYTHHRIPTAI